MCSICRKFKKGSLTAEEARAELEEQAEFLTEEHIEDIEEMLSEAEDVYDYINERQTNYDLEEFDEDYDDDGLDPEDEEYSLDNEDE